MESFVNACVPFAVGCCSGMVATVCIQPIDTVKVRMQLTDQSNGKASPWSVARRVVARDGILNLYQGLSAGLLRQLVYGTLRLGLFSTFDQYLERKAREKGRELGFGGRALAGLSAGALAALVGTPTEVALIQMQGDSMRPLVQRRNYSSALNALYRIAKDEGVFSLWKGGGPTIIRAMSTNFGQLAFFSESKHQISKYSAMSAQRRTVLASIIAGFAGAFISLPFDFVKTRIQNQLVSGNAHGLPFYSGTIDCFTRVIKSEGLFRFYKDFWPYFLRVAPHSIIALSLTDWLNELIKKRRRRKA